MGNRVLYGPLPGGGDGIRVSKPGFNVLTETDPRRLAFDSDWNFTAKFYRQGIVSLGPSPGGGVEVTSTVNFGETLPSVPFVFAITETDFNPGEDLKLWNVYSDSMGQQWPGAEGDGWYPQYTAFTNRIVFRNVRVVNIRVAYIVVLIQ